MTTFVNLPGSRSVPLPLSRPAGPVDRSAMAALTVRVRGIKDNLKELEERVYEQSAKSLKDREYLSPEEYTKMFGASSADLDRVEQFAQTHNLTVAHRSDAARTVVLRGTLGSLLNAFPARVDMFHHANGTYRGRTGDIQIPAELADVVTGVLGYDNRPKHRAPRFRRFGAADGPGGENGVAATAFAQRYNFPERSGGVPLDGTGQTIAIIELGGGFRSGDLQAYFQEIGIFTPLVSFVSVDHAANSPSTAGSADDEVMLDIEVAGAVAPKAKFVLYFAPNDGDRGFFDAISQAVHDSQRRPNVISISWGGPESSVEKQTNDAFHELFVAAASMGITVCVASGDHGTADVDAAQWDRDRTPTVRVDAPAHDPLVLACGGTQIDANDQDVVWNEGTPFDLNSRDGGGWCSGGGISQSWPVPPYQMGANLPPALNNGQPGRGVPDIAMSATNYFTRIDSSEGVGGGTSAVAPLMASLVARLNQAKGKNVGFLNTFLYANASKGVVQDVTSGNNEIKDAVPGYNARPGWDACTGLGTPNGAAILECI